MAVDRGYGSGKPLTAAQSRGRRRVAKGQLSKGKGNLAAKSKVQALKTTGKLPPSKFDEFSFDAGLSIPFGIAGNIIKKLLPQSVQVAGAASRVVKGATSRLSAAEARIAAGEGMQAAGLAVKQSARNVPKTPRSVRLGLDWDNPVGNRPNQSYNYVIKDVTKGVNPEAPRSAWEISEAGRQMMNAGSNTAYNAARAARRSQKVIDAGKSEAAVEIKRRLAALQRANRNR